MGLLSQGLLVPCQGALSRLYRRLFLEALEKAFDKRQLEFYGDIAGLAQTEAFERLLEKYRRIDWIVDSTPPFGGASKVLDYLARYTHRVAISNHRLVDLKNGRVSFTWRDYRHGGRPKTMPLEVDEFIRRFLQHVLPSGFVRIRHYGLFANRYRALNLARCRAALGVDVASGNEQTQERDWADLVETLTGEDPRRCPKCRRGRLIRLRDIAPIRLPVTAHSRVPP